MKISNELKTGGFIFVAIVVLAVILFKTGDLTVAKKGYAVSTRITVAAGVKKFAPVRLAGVEVGEITDLKLVYEEAATVVEATLLIQDGVQLRTDSLAVISSLGLMGEKYIEIKAGTATEFVAAGGTIQSKTPVSLEDLMEEFQGLGDDLKLTLSDIRKLTNNANTLIDGNKSKLSRIMDNLESTTEYFNEFAEDVKHHPWKVLAKGKEKTPEELEKDRAARAARRLALTVSAPVAGEPAPAAAGTVTQNNFSKPKR